MIKYTYFAFTTLTTTGLGDVSPISASERLFGSMMLFGGVAMFSYIMGIFQGILSEYTAYDQDLQSEQGYQLIMFFQCLNKLNGEESIKYDYQHKLEQYFIYQWEQNKNIAVESNEDLMMQLPTHVRQEIYLLFLWQDFYKKFSTFFIMENSVFNPFGMGSNKQFYPLP